MIVETNPASYILWTKSSSAAAVFCTDTKWVGSCGRESGILTSVWSSSRLLMRASLLKGAARGWLSKGNSSSQAGDAESMKRVAKLPSAREKASFQAAREMFCCCCWLCCKCTKIMYCHLLVVPSSKKTSLCEAVMWFQQSSGKRHAVYSGERLSWIVSTASDENEERVSGIGWRDLRKGRRLGQLQFPKCWCIKEKPCLDRNS